MRNMCFLLFVMGLPFSCFATGNGTWFIGLGAGNAKYQKSAFDADDNLRLLSGGYRFNSNVSIEVGYMDLGKVEDRVIPGNIISLTQDTLALEAKGFTAASVIGWEMNQSLSLSGKLGISILDINKRWSGGTLVDSDLANDTGGTETEIFYGVELQYKVNESFSFGLSWDRYQVEEIDVDGVYAKAGFYF